MFYQYMILTGYFILWVLYGVIFTVYMGSIVKEGKMGKTSRDFGMYVVRMYGISLSNVFLALSLVILPLFGLAFGVHSYWLAMGTIYTLIVHFYYLRLMVWGEIYLTRLDKKETKLIENNNVRILYIILVVMMFGYFMLMAFNAFDIVPLQKVFLPPIMPLYYHLILDLVILLGLFLISALTLFVTKKRLDSLKEVKN